MAYDFGKNYFYGYKDSNYLNYDKLNPSKLFEGILYFVRKYGIKGNLLDVGCAFGFLLRELSPTFNELHGFDVSKFAIEKAKKVVPEAKLKVLSLDGKLPYPDRKFDCITAVDVLEHTKSFEKNFEKITKKLKKGGFLIVSTPLKGWPRKAFWFMDKDKTHISVLREEKLQRIIKKNKMDVVEKRYYLPFPIIYRISGIPFSVEILLQKNNI
jgi:2-polyprenyl-3-methyl-5-hydroxy-6-metoxy-1,4-benzoquinol methylase